MNLSLTVKVVTDKQLKGVCVCVCVCGQFESFGSRIERVVYDMGGHSGEAGRTAAEGQARGSFGWRVSPGGIEKKQVRIEFRVIF